MDAHHCRTKLARAHRSPGNEEAAWVMASCGARQINLECSSGHCWLITPVEMTQTSRLCADLVEWHLYSQSACSFTVKGIRWGNMFLYKAVFSSALFFPKWKRKENSHQHLYSSLNKHFIKTLNRIKPTVLLCFQPLCLATCWLQIQI